MHVKNSICEYCDFWESYHNLPLCDIGPNSDLTGHNGRMMFCKRQTRKTHLCFHMTLKRIFCCLPFVALGADFSAISSGTHRTLTEATERQGFPFSI